MLMPAELKGCITWIMYFLDLLWLRYMCAKFYHRRICVTDFMEGGFLGSPPPPPTHHPWAAPKRPFLKKVKWSNQYNTKGIQICANKGTKTRSLEWKKPKSTKTQIERYHAALVTLWSLIPPIECRLQFLILRKKNLQRKEHFLEWNKSTYLWTIKYNLVSSRPITQGGIATNPGFDLKFTYWKKRTQEICSRIKQTYLYPMLVNSRSLTYVHIFSYITRYVRFSVEVKFSEHAANRCYKRP